ncbi:MAG: hypothetical protein MJY74_01690 [Bacteroidaceae bacterium]|nr:hypothetical protein [Bacteroidaceae bacterium]
MSSKKQQYYEGLIAAARPMEELTEVLNYVDEELKEGCLTEIGKKAFNLIHEYFILEAYAHAPLGNIMGFLSRWVNIDAESLKEFERPIAYRSGQIYDIISNVSPDNAYMVLTKLSEYSDVYERLCEAYENKDKDGFIKVMSENKCDTKAVTEICNFYSKTDKNSVIKEIDDDDIDIAFDNIHDYFDEFNDSSDEVKEANNYLNSMLNTMSELTDVFEGNIQEEHIEHLNSLFELTENRTKEIYFQFLDCEKDNTPKEQEVLDQITTRPEVAEYFRQWREEYLTLSSEELKAETESTRASSSGRNPGCWLIMGSLAELSRWNTIIQIKVWPKVFKVVSAFKYTKTTSKKLEKAINNMGASLIYKAAENIGIAKEYSKNDVASSYARTMSFIGCERRDIKPYMEMLDVYMQCVEQDKQNKFESRHRLSGDESGTYSRRNSSYNEKMDSVDVRDILADYCNKNEEMAQFLADNKPKIKEALIMIRQLLSSHK